MSIISDSSFIVKAARALMAINDAGAMPDFEEQLFALRRAWRKEELEPDREARYRWNPTYENMADILGRMFCCERDEALNALKIVNGDLLPALQVNCLFEFARELRTKEAA
jgi:hypothetical protein